MFSPLCHFLSTNMCISKGQPPQNFTFGHNKKRRDRNKGQSSPLLPVIIYTFIILLNLIRKKKTTNKPHLTLLCTPSCSRLPPLTIPLARLHRGGVDSGGAGEWRRRPRRLARRSHCGGGGERTPPRHGLHHLCVRGRQEEAVRRLQVREGKIMLMKVNAGSMRMKNVEV